MAKAAEVGLAKILLFPAKWAALAANAGGLDFSFPVSVELSLTNRCQQRCRWCSDAALRGRSPDRLDLPALRRLFAALAAGGTLGVTIEGGGEPTLAPFFDESVAAAREAGLACGLITNGLDLFPAGRDPALYGQFEWLRVSLDAATAAQYAALKGVDGFGRVVANVERLRSAAPQAALGVGYVLARGNDDVAALVKLAEKLRDMGVDYLHVRPVVDHPEMISAADVSPLAALATAKFDVNLAALAENAEAGNGGLPCLCHSLTSVIGADGAVWLCGRLNTQATDVPLGNVLEAPFGEIWRGAERARQAAQVAEGAWAAAHCPMCRLTKFNRLWADVHHLTSRHFI